MTQGTPTREELSTRAAQIESQRKVLRPWRHDCSLCEDTGRVSMEQIHNEQHVLIVYRCTCHEGDRYPALEPLPRPYEERY